MIDSKFAAEQIQRLSGLDFYPKERAALKEMRVALECAASDAIAEAVVSDWLATASDAPKPSELRRMAYDLNEKFKEQVKYCRSCGGSGMVVIWKLVTYHGKSFNIKRNESIADDQVRDLADKLAAEPLGSDRQMILSAAENCACRKF